MKSIRVFLVSMFVLSMLALASPAGAQQYPPDVLGDVIRRDPQPIVEPEVLHRRITTPGILPFTGADLARFVLIGFVTIGAGVVIVRRFRTDELG